MNKVYNAIFNLRYVAILAVIAPFVGSALMMLLGTKDTIEMSEVFQRKRLAIYSNIIIAVNELLFKVLEESTDFKPHDRYYLPPHF